MKFYKSNPVQAGLILLFLFFAMSFYLISIYVAQERKRDLNGWQSKLNIMADVNQEKLESFLNAEKDKLQELSANSSLKLFLTENYLNNVKNDDVYHAQYAHIRNLIHSVAKDYGFVGANQDSVNTESDPRINKGLALVDSEGRILMATKGFIKDDNYFRDVMVATLESGEIKFIDLFKLENNQVLHGYVAPIMPIHGTGSGMPVGALILLLDADETIYKTIKSIHVDMQTDEMVLIRESEESITYLSPLIGDFRLFHQRAKDNSDMASVFAISNPGEFSIKKDYKDTQVLVLGRKIKGTEWVLMQKINADEALKESDEHQRFLVVTLTLAILLMSVLFVAIWRHSTSKRLEKLTNDLESRTALLDAVSDNINEHIFLLDKNDSFIFSNMSLARFLNVIPNDVVGKSAASVLGTEVASILNDLSCEGKKTNTSKCMLSIPIGHEENIYHISTVTLSSGDYKDAKLFVLHDVTALKKEQEKRDRLARGIISTLVKAVDLHDPYCVDHSSRTREVALAIAEEMRLTLHDRESLEMASLLANIGKLFIPKEILIKMEKLSDEEDAKLKKNIAYAVDILRQLEFDGPVVKIISQKNEYLDGSGYPEGLTADEILLESKILSVANAFVAMASSRAYRKGRKIKEVIDILLEQADHRYDRKVVAALFHIAENRTDWNKWQDVNDFSS